MLKRLAILFVICLGSILPLTAGDTLSILFTGDVLLDRGIRPYIERKGTEALFAGVRNAFRKTDAVIINLECPLTDVASPIGKRFVFRGESSWAEGLAAAGITHAAMANNHTNDQGRHGLSDTYRNLKKAGIEPLGYGLTTAEQLTPTLIRKGNIKVAVFNAVLFPLENWQHIEGKPGICQPAASTLVKAIKTYKARHPDEYVVAVVHWGSEFQRVPHLTQRRQARLLIDAGTDAIVGHHPHVLQNNETINGKPVFYSLGNFVFDQTHPDTHKSLILTLHFTEQGLTGISTTPVRIDRCRPYTVKQR